MKSLRYIFYITLSTIYAGELTISQRSAIRCLYETIKSKDPINEFQQFIHDDSKCQATKNDLQTIIHQYQDTLNKKKYRYEANFNRNGSLALPFMSLALYYMYNYIYNSSNQDSMNYYLLGTWILALKFTSCAFIYDYGLRYVKKEELDIQKIQTILNEWQVSKDK